jgi:hypothetical protein
MKAAATCALYVIFLALAGCSVAPTYPSQAYGSSNPFGRVYSAGNEAPSPCGPWDEHAY